MISAKNIAISVAAVMASMFAQVSAAAEPIEIVRSRPYVTRDTGALDADVYMPKGAGPFPGMLVVHGGAWRVGTRAQLASVAARFAENGYTAVAISYRLAPQSKFPAQIYDCQAAVRWMRAHADELKIDPLRIGGFGYSAGGHLVALLGTMTGDELLEDGLPANAPSTRLQCVLAGGAPCDFRDIPPNVGFLSYWLAGTPAERPENYRNASPANFISADDPPMYFFSGENDLLVPISSPQQMVASLTKAGVEAAIHPVKNAGHLQTLFDPVAMHEALAFADAHLKANSAASRGVPAPEDELNVRTDGRAHSKHGGEDAPARTNEARDGN
jgi:acetyl esterase/lipase